MNKLRTGISQAFWCVPNDQQPFNPAKIPFKEISDTEKPISSEKVFWLDELLKGGISLPTLSEGQNGAITILLTGPAGAGKSTLALEMCYRLSQQDASREIEQYRKGLNSLYITSEGKSSWVQEKVASYGWRESSVFIVPKIWKEQDIPSVILWETQDFSSYLEYESSSMGIHPIIQAMLGLMPFSETLKDLISTTGEAVRNVFTDQMLLDKIQLPKPDILVVDSVNTLETDKHAETFKRFMNMTSAGPRIIIMILDAKPNHKHGEFWTYTSDIVLHLDRKHYLDYTTRTLEIVKARYQPHVEGAHQLKVYPPNKVPERFPRSENEIIRARRAHPYREEGGIFIFPSIHYYLSLNKRRSPGDSPGRFSAPLPSLDKILKNGFPSGRCTIYYFLIIITVLVE